MGIGCLKGARCSDEPTAGQIGGSALLETIIGAIAGGGKGAAIGAAAGAGAGAGVQIPTRGKKVNVPAEPLLPCRLEKSLRIGVADNGITCSGRHCDKTNR